MALISDFKTCTNYYAVIYICSIIYYTDFRLASSGSLKKMFEIWRPLTKTLPFSFLREFIIFQHLCSK